MLRWVEARWDDEVHTGAINAKVRRMRLRDGLSITEIARRTSLSRNTITAWLRASVRSEMQYRRPAGPRRERRTARKLYAQLQAQGFSGSYARVTEFIRAWRTDQGRSPRAAYIPLTFAWGETFQFDWSEEGLVIDGVRWGTPLTCGRSTEPS